MKKQASHPVQQKSQRRIRPPGDRTLADIDGLSDVSKQALSSEENLDSELKRSLAASSWKEC